MSDKKVAIENQVTVKPAKSYTLILLIVITTIFGIFCGVGAISCLLAGKFLDGIYYTSLTSACVTAVVCHHKIHAYVKKHVDPTVSRKF